MSTDRARGIGTPSALVRGADAVLSVVSTLIPSLFMVGAFGVISYAVIARHFLNISFAGANEIAQLCCVWLVMLGCARAVRYDAMIVVGVTSARFEERFRRVLTMPRLIAYLVTLAFITWPCIVMLTKTSQEYEALGISKAWGVAALPVGFILVALALIVRTSVDGIEPPQSGWAKSGEE